ncbi:MAG: hypothetical protein K9M54_08100 [Kiritimatiellales bacterium]|nr:hypothetical protein [Kiritimatiellales bacterium]
MKTKTTDTWNRNRGRVRLGDELFKGAFVWGTLYSVGASASACYLAPLVAGKTLSFPEVFDSSLLIFPLVGAVRGLVMWRVKTYKTTERTCCKTPDACSKVRCPKPNRRTPDMRPKHA